MYLNISIFYMTKKTFFEESCLVTIFSIFLTKVQTFCEHKSFFVINV